MDVLQYTKNDLLLNDIIRHDIESWCDTKLYVIDFTCSCILIYDIVLLKKSVQSSLILYSLYLLFYNSATDKSVPRSCKAWTRYPF